MAIYRRDKDLKFLAECDNKDLAILVAYLTKGKDGNLRLTEGLSFKKTYKRHHPNHKAYWKDIAAELQTFGGNTFANVVRGDKGPLYKDILADVARKMKVKFKPRSRVEAIETNLLMKILTDSLKKMTPRQLKKIVKTTGLKTTNFTPQAVAAALQIACRKAGFWAVNKLALQVANTTAKMVLGSGLRYATNAAISTTVAETSALLTGPIGWTLTGLWTLADLAGPAYRVTIPSIIQIAYMRAKMTEVV